MKLHNVTVNLNLILFLPNQAIIHFKHLEVSESALFTNKVSHKIEDFSKKCLTWGHKIEKLRHLGAELIKILSDWL